MNGDKCDVLVCLIATLFPAALALFVGITAIAERIW